MLIGYVRPLQEDPTCEDQLKKLAHCDRIAREEHASAKRRVQLSDMIDHLQKGDQVVVAKLYVLADSTRHLVELLDVIDQKGAVLQSIREEINTNDVQGYSFRTIVKHMVEFQSDVISERTKKGLNRAKQKGISTGRPRKPDENVQKAIEMYQSKQYSLNEIREQTGISKSTLYRYLEN
ncbi:recombinase family protein [Siminovitchia sediminis]|uniref:Recombinase family protein n=1 Tax=Siminovitchia sediminis TaxID=1274353 RepID=A0ABW4KFU6_9BACI